MQKIRVIIPNETKRVGNRDLKELSFAELTNVQLDFQKGMRYNEIRTKYRLKPYSQLDRNLFQIIQELKDDLILNSLNWSKSDAYTLIDHYNSYGHGIVFSDLNHDFRSVEDLEHYLNESGMDFEMEIQRIDKIYNKGGEF